MINKTMKKLPSNFVLDKYGLHARLVCEDDAAFIVKIRTNENLSRYIHKYLVHSQKNKNDHLLFS